MTPDELDLLADIAAHIRQEFAGAKQRLHERGEDFKRRIETCS